MCIRDSGDAATGNAATGDAATGDDSSADESNTHKANVYKSYVEVSFKKISFMLTVQFQGGQRELIKVHCLCLLVQAKKSVYLLNIYLKSSANQLITLMA